MADRARGIHVSPGVYMNEKVIDYAAKSLGITTLGAVGETLRGPAFQPIRVEDWNEFRNIFGGTSPEKFKGSQYPKYELPYIAQSYLEESRQLDVVRVLGLSGYNAGPAWCVTAEGVGNTKTVIAVLRSNGHYDNFRRVGQVTDCNCTNLSFDRMTFDTGEMVKTKQDSGSKCPDVTKFNASGVTIDTYSTPYTTGDCNGTGMSGSTNGFIISALDFGKFNLNVNMDVVSANASGNSRTYAVSLNPNDNDYILKVLGTDPSNTDTPIYVESLYDVALHQGIANGSLTKISSELTFYQVYFPTEYCGLEPVTDLMRIPESSLTRKDVGKRFLGWSGVINEDSDYTVHPYDYETKSPLINKNVASGDTLGNVDGEPVIEQPKAGQIYIVKQYTDINGKRHYFYAYFDHASINKASNISDNPLHLHDNLKGNTEIASGNTKNEATLVKCNADGLYYRVNGTSNTDVYPVTCDLNNYKSAYRYASTPWFVSNLKGDRNHIELNKLFRFHTISDGNASNYEIKVSIENIRPDDGIFDVVIRDINDSDTSVVVLERFSKCTLVPGTTNYLAYKVGSFDGNYVSRSKYVTVEINENQATRTSVPAGFLGYPLTSFNGLPISGDVQSNVKMPDLMYNTTFEEDIKNRKQYFGLSDLVGVDVDAFTYKGVMAYYDAPNFISKGFHLDCRVNNNTFGGSGSTLTVDGVSGYTFAGVDVNSTTQVLTEAPIIGTETDMYGTIYEYVNLRKFTAFFYGGFDGWDIYRRQRSNTDDFKLSKYRGQYNDANGEGYAFNKIYDPESLMLNQNGITSDFYAYLSGIRQFSNPSTTDINVFCTPGIDYVNNRQLVEEAIEMIEEERADSIYVITTPDHPSGSGDYKNEMYSPDDAVYNLEDSEIDSNYGCTYYPWVKYTDSANAQYIYLPPTRDVVKNFASTDNKQFSWFAPAGVSRGNISGINAKYHTTNGDEDILYEGRINPVKTFAVDGPKVWGQKNLQLEENQLNRIAVRRLLLRMRKLIAIACRQIIFDPNDPTTKQTFLSAVTPIMDNIKSNRGISDYILRVEETTEDNERRELNAVIAFKPYQALEWINLSFVVTPEGVSFENI